MTSRSVENMIDVILASVINDKVDDEVPPNVEDVHGMDLVLKVAHVTDLIHKRSAIAKEGVNHRDLIHLGETLRSRGLVKARRLIDHLERVIVGNDLLLEVMFQVNSLITEP